jgi:hypothetical protein
MGGKYCIECKFAGDTSGSLVKCEKFNTWMPKYGSCNDYIWKNARFRGVRGLIMMLLSLLGR